MASIFFCFSLTFNFIAVGKRIPTQTEYKSRNTISLECETVDAEYVIRCHKEVQAVYDPIIRSNTRCVQTI